MTHEMLYNNVLVKPDPVEQNQQLPSGLFIPTTAAPQDATTGTVIAVGPGIQSDFGIFVTPTVKVGDHVMFRSYQMGFEITVDHEKHLIFNNRDLMAILTE